MGFLDEQFEVVFCLQNGLSAIGGSPENLIKEALRVTAPGGVVFFSSYSPKIWEERLEWFQRQAKEGLLGELDMERCRDGVIVCRDGFQATTFTTEDFKRLTKPLKKQVEIYEVDNSSIFCRITK